MTVFLLVPLLYIFSHLYLGSSRTFWIFKSSLVQVILLLVFIFLLLFSIFVLPSSSSPLLPPPFLPPTPLPPLLLPPHPLPFSISSLQALSSDVCSWVSFVLLFSDVAMETRLIFALEEFLR